MGSDTSASGGTFATYLADWHMAKKGFRLGTVPEAAALELACDLVLTKLDGMVLTMLCIVDRERDPAARFDLGVVELIEIGRACRKYCGSISGGSKLPVVIQVVEVCAGPADDADRRRLRSLRTPLFSKVKVWAFRLDTQSRTALANIPFGFWRRYFERILRAPRLGEGELRPPAPAAVRGPVMPVLTISLLLLLVVVFALEQQYAVRTAGLMEPDVRSLVAMGGLARILVFDVGEWYRLLSATVLHGSVLHLLFNGIALYLAASILEEVASRLWLGALFVICAVAGSLVSAGINAPTTVSVGASGAIMGLLAAAFCFTYRYPVGPERGSMQISLMRVLIPSLLPLATTGGHAVDFGAHFGGALSGGLVGFALLRAWPAAAPLPPYRRLAGVVCAIGAGGYVLAACLVVARYAAYIRPA